MRKIIAIGLVLAVCSCFFTKNARTQELRYTQEEYTLAVVCVNEITFAKNDDCVGIYEVLKYRAENVFHTTFIEAARIYSDNAFNPSRTGRTWIAFLRPSATQPRYWPSTLTWDDPSTEESDGYSALWIQRLEEARSIVRGEHTVRCDHTPHHWGSRSDIERNGWLPRIRQGKWAYANCGDTLNRFIYRVH